MKFGAIRPLFLLVLGAHAALLAIPISGASDEIVPAPDPEGDTITVTRIPPQDDEAAGTKAAEQPAVGQRATQPQPTTAAARPATGQPTPATQAAAQQGGSATTQQRRSPGSRGASSSRQNSSGDDNGSDQASSGRDDQDTGGLSDLPPERQPATPPPSRASDDDAGTSLVAALQTGARRGNLQALAELMSSFGDALTFNNVQTSAEDEAAETNKWLEQLQTETGNANLTAQSLDTTLNIFYPLEETTAFEEDDWAYDRNFVGCLSHDPTPAKVGLYFNRRGELVDEPVLLRSSGYSFLDAEALARAERFAELPSDRAGRAFTVPVEIEYREQGSLLGGTCSPSEAVARTDAE